MRRLNFGLIRKSSGVYKNTLDTHNLLGIATLAWTLVVGSTGVINAWSDLVIKFWQSDQMAAMTAGYQYMPPPLTYTSLQSAVQTAQSHEPSMRLSFIAFPGTDFSSLHHYTIYMKGDSPLTKRLFKPILIDAQTGRYTDSREIPWYLIILLISQPLHFGDYGGLPLKILWALFDLIAIVVLWSGLKLWWLKRNVYKKYSERDHAEAIKNI